MMTQKEHVVFLAIAERNYIINDRPITFYNTGTYRVDRDYDTKEGTWSISEREDGFRILTFPDLGILKVDISIQMEF